MIGIPGPRADGRGAAHVEAKCDENQVQSDDDFGLHASCESDGAENESHTELERLFFSYILLAANSGSRD
jgi:hypothetical protein